MATKSSDLTVASNQTNWRENPALWVVLSISTGFTAIVVVLTTALAVGGVTSLLAFALSIMPAIGYMLKLDPGTPL